MLEKIIALKLARIRARVAANHNAELVYDDALVDAIFSRCTEVDSGARNVDHILNGSVLPEISASVLTRMAEAKPIRKIRLSANAAGQFQYKVS